MSDSRFSRRQFLEFMGRTTLAAAITPQLLSCTSNVMTAAPGKLPFAPLKPNKDDQLSLAQGFKYDILIKWQDKLTRNGQTFGFNNDFTTYLPLRQDKPDEGLLWVNHEYVDPLFITGWTPGQKRTKADVTKEMKEVGGSVVQIKKENGVWKQVPYGFYNRRINAQTKIPFVSERPIEGATHAIGTLANCAGGVTPWRTILTCEENYDTFYGENFIKDGVKTWAPGGHYVGWKEAFDYPPEHYGWVVEVNPFTGDAKKLTALGRFSHECATTVIAPDGRCVVYSGDDQADECLYKFIAAKAGSLEKGELFVADTVNGKWLSLNIESHPELKKRFSDQTDCLIHAREAARIVGATLLDRPEDVDVDPVTKAVIVALSNNKKKGNLHGSLLKIEEKNGDPRSLDFKASTFIAGGPATGVSCPDNLVFDKKGNLWFTNDISDSVINTGAYTPFMNNGLYYVPMSGANAGKVFQVASAPVNAELTGPSFSPDYRTLFLSVQHPGEGTTDLKNPLSRWPDGGAETPKPAVVTISGEGLDALVL